MKRIINSEKALDLIAEVLAEEEWTPDHLERIARVVEATGRDIDDFVVDI